MTARMSTLRVVVLSALTAAMLMAVLLLGSGTASAGVEIFKFEAYPTQTQAGGHPDVVVTFDTEEHNSVQTPDPALGNDPRNITVDLPAGVIGNPHAYPKCDAASFTFDNCPIDAQIGVARPLACLGPGFCVGGSEVSSPIFNLHPEPDQAGLIGFKVVVFNSPVFNVIGARTGSDYGLRVDTKQLQHIITVAQFRQTIWGVPSHPKNDGEDWPADNIDQFGAEVGRFASGQITLGKERGLPSNWPLRPFMQAPTTCGEPLESTMTILAFDGEVTKASAPWPATTGCGLLSFGPSLSANPTTTAADSPSGVDAIVKVPQFQSPTVPSPSQIRATEVVLPEGFSINTNTAVGKTACTDAQARFGTEEEAQCPEFAKVGTLEIHSAVLPDVLPGAIYLGEPQPGNRYRLFLVADGFGVHVKLPGTVSPDPNSGRLTINFDDLPQTPFQEFVMHFFGSERGALATPTKCGRYAVESTFTPWTDTLPQQTSTQFFEISSGPGGTPCPAPTRPFEPGFQAASDGNTAGSHTPYRVNITRQDGHQFMTGLNVTPPPGFSGKLAGIPYCSEAALASVQSPLRSGLTELAAPACSPASQIGTTTAGAGAGSRPLYQEGKVYLAGPYKGAPLSLAVVIPAVSGPYDLGNIVVRVAIQVNPTTGRITTVSDPLPQIIEGIPLRARSIQVNIDRPNFALNPTNCGRLSTDAQIFGDEGALAPRSSHYQAANCGTLAFDPNLTLRLRGNMKRTGHPALEAVLRPNPGDANIGRAAVTLPASTILDQGNIGTICTRVQWAAEACPAGSIYGTAIAHTPLLGEPLRGPVHLRASDNELPDLVADLDGQVDFELAGAIDSQNGGLRTIFRTVPDVPVSRFVLRMQGGGKSGLIINTRSLCARGAGRARSVMRGQNGRRQATRLKLRTNCKKSGKRKRRASVSHVRKAG